MGIVSELCENQFVSYYARVLQNINKYANANTIKIDLKKKNDDLVLVISDNGRGFDAKVKERYRYSKYDVSNKRMPR
jgi:signal transduction histidine kinase